MYLEFERKIAIQAVIKASLLCRSVFKNLPKSDTLIKSDNSPVTIADLSSQAVINTILKKNFKNDFIVAEEDSQDILNNSDLKKKVLDLSNKFLADEDKVSLSDSQLLKNIDEGSYEGGETGRFWTLDPIDGTKGFLRGEQFAVCLALIINGKVELGVIGCPNLPLSLSEQNSPKGSILIAVKGGGSFQRSIEDAEEYKISSEKEKTLKNCSICESVEALHSNQSEASKISKHLGIEKSPVRMDSQCKYGIIARGDASIYLRLPTNPKYQEKIWDHAAGSLIVSEAGGCVSDMYGNDLNFSKGRYLNVNKGIIACGNKEIHEKVLEAVKNVFSHL
ncbi:hypothetical protein HK099_005494 [Clydaea vesicula]|uniref:3'(2'),5'-bisphosphate nucleotidase n=1 Tax=Clydaea vesicula TaxID=447962 RepID=A0AAD5Y2S4_9FUNG|nr:hypothetical protein HK099_005494 [Clydaea vesicula]KAJ3396218.1 hypothetical protein HDU92_003676 [Lobulomyces angularis]